MTSLQVTAVDNGAITFTFEVRRCLIGQTAVHCLCLASQCPVQLLIPGVYWVQEDDESAATFAETVLSKGKGK